MLGGCGSLGCAAGDQDMSRWLRWDAISGRAAGMAVAQQRRGGGEFAQSCELSFATGRIARAVSGLESENSRGRPAAAAALGAFLLSGEGPGVSGRGRHGRWQSRKQVRRMTAISIDRVFRCPKGPPFCFAFGASMRRIRAATLRAPRAVPRTCGGACRRVVIFRQLGPKRD